MDNTHFQLFVAPPWPHVAVTSQSFCIAEACGKRCHCIHLARPNPPIYFNIFLSPHNYTYTCLFSCPSGPSGLLSNFNYQDEKSKAIHWPPELDRKSFFKCGCKKDSFHTHHPIVYRASLPFPPSPSLLLLPSLSLLIFEWYKMFSSKTTFNSHTRQEIVAYF